jgi:hypothetical protein
MQSAHVSRPEDLRQILPRDILPGEIIGILQIRYHVFKRIAAAGFRVGQQTVGGCHSQLICQSPYITYFSWMGQLASWDLVMFHSEIDASAANI